MANSFLMGVNLAGAEFAPQHVPGVFGTDYTYPTHTEIDYYASKGLDVIRLPFLAAQEEGAPLKARWLSLQDFTRIATRYDRPARCFLSTREKVPFLASARAHKFRDPKLLVMRAGIAA